MLLQDENKDHVRTNLQGRQHLHHSAVTADKIDIVFLQNKLSVKVPKD